MPMHDFSVGQVWAYRNRDVDQGSTLTISRLEDVPNLGRVVHISIAGLSVKNSAVPGGYSTDLPHAPFTVAAVQQSVTKLVGQASPPAAFHSGYQVWQRSNGGVFTISVAEAIDFVEKGINQ